MFSTLERIANILPSLRVYVKLYSDSKLQMLKDPLVNVYADIITFGLGAVKLLNKSRIREEGPSLVCVPKANLSGRHGPFLPQQIIAKGT